MVTLGIRHPPTPAMPRNTSSAPRPPLPGPAPRRSQAAFLLLSVPTSPLCKDVDLPAVRGPGRPSRCPCFPRRETRRAGPSPAAAAAMQCENRGADSLRAVPRPWRLSAAWVLPVVRRAPRSRCRGGCMLPSQSSRPRWALAAAEEPRGRRIPLPNESLRVGTVWPRSLRLHHPSPRR